MRALLLVVCLSAPLARAQVDIRINVPLPTIVFPAPPALVVVQPGVQVVEDYDDEVFFVDGAYWCRRDGRWFRAKTHSGGWVVVEEHLVPRPIVVLPPGQYRRWKRGHGTTVVVDPPGPGKVKVKVKRGHHH